MQVNLTEWNQYIAENPQAHIMQHGGWGEFKHHFGWSVIRIRNEFTGVQLMIRSMPFAFKLAYIPKGPIGSGWESLLTEIHEICRSKGVFVLRLEPDEWESGEFSRILERAGFLPAPPVQPRRSIVVDLRAAEEEILNRMKQKTRYNIRLAAKKEIIIHPTDDVKTFYNLLLQTGDRDRFGIHRYEYYQKAYDLLSADNACHLLIATFKNQPLAGLMVFKSGSRAWYFYGASIEAERERMPAYLLQWEAMRWAKNLGCTEYDLWGVPDENEETLEKEFPQRSDGLWGVYRFKRGFGGQLRRTAGAWDFVYSPMRYWLFNKILAIRKFQFN
jgi:lipid II:glycine glycyltransferase (peptidoglycan interpeptide bridge formation enzyme)